MSDERYEVGREDLIEALHLQKGIMVSVSTGGPKIDSVNGDYQDRYGFIRDGLAERGIEDPNPFRSLWDWYGKWSSGELPGYQSRRTFLSQMFDPLIESVERSESSLLNPLFEEPTGWMRVDRGITEIKHRLGQAGTEEQYQAVGLLCRETLISLAQVVYDKDEHTTTDGVNPSDTDAKRMLEAYIASALEGSENYNLRRYVRASNDLANELTHKRTANFRLAALCSEATNAVINAIAIVSGIRDQES